MNEWEEGGGGLRRTFSIQNNKQWLRCLQEPLKAVDICGGIMLVYICEVSTCVIVFDVRDRAAVFCPSLPDPR